MRTGQTFPLPRVTPEHDEHNEATMRRTVEQHLEDLRNDVVEIRDKGDSPSSLALRRFQFLLMGAR
jgi:hypothetical protein